MIAIVIISKNDTFTKDGIAQIIANKLPIIQERDGKPRFISNIRVAGKVNDDHTAVLLAATVEGDTAHEAPTETLFVAVGQEYDIGELAPEIVFFIRDLECLGRVGYHAQHGDLDCMSFRTPCGKAVVDMIMADADLPNLRLSK